MNSITRRWVKGSLLITIIVMLFAEGLFVYFAISSSYENASTTVQMQANTLISQIAASNNQTETSRNIVLRNLLEQFAEKDRYEVLLINENGTVAASSFGYVTHGEILLEGTQKTVGSNIGESVYITPQQEKVMAYTVMLPTQTGSIVALRVVTSLALLDETIFDMVLTSLVLVIAVVLFSVWSGMFFVRSIVRPIADIEHTAAKIARGQFDIRIENRYHSAEIDKLTNTINHMAQELGKSEHMKNEFISSVSHELRTPLTSIKGWIETIANIQDTSDVNYQRGVAVIASETDRLYAMVEDLLDFSTMEKGLHLALQLLDLAAEVIDVEMMVERRIALEGLHLHYQEPELPIPVQADPARLRQVLLNVLDNAIKYSAVGDTITIEILTDGANAFINIIDQGKGIAPEDLENVTLRFFKGSGAVRGSGIGLAVVDDIMRAHQGAISLQSTLGKGTTVTLRLPLHR